MKHNSQQLVASKIDLLTLPSVYARVKQVVDDSGSTATDLAEVVSNDPAMTARLLRLVNSAIWGVRSRVESVPLAVTVLGMTQVHDLVLATAVATAFSGVAPRTIDVARFWRGSVARALAAAAFARQAGLAETGRAFTQGLLSDLGHMVLYQTVPDLAAQALAAAGNEPWRLASLERDLIGCDYASVGAELSDRWRLPPAFGAAIRAQCAPQDAIEHPIDAALIHLAGALADARDAGDRFEVHAAAILPDAWTTTGLVPGCLPATLDEVRIHLAATVEAFGLGN
jgi:HD-like signal output (HDOD) protein